MSEQRMRFGSFVDHVFLAAISAAAIYAAHSINELNEKMAVVIERLSYSDKRADAQDVRLERLERAIRR